MNGLLKGIRGCMALGASFTERAAQTPSPWVAARGGDFARVPGCVRLPHTRSWRPTPVQYSLTPARNVLVMVRCAAPNSSECKPVRAWSVSARPAIFLLDERLDRR